jgi:hypothetical protein
MCWNLLGVADLVQCKKALPISDGVATHAELAPERAVCPSTVDLIAEIVTERLVVFCFDSGCRCGHLRAHLSDQ